MKVISVEYGLITDVSKGAIKEGIKPGNVYAMFDIYESETGEIYESRCFIIKGINKYEEYGCDYIFVIGSDNPSLFNRNSSDVEVLVDVLNSETFVYRNSFWFEYGGKRIKEEWYAPEPIDYWELCAGLGIEDAYKDCDATSGTCGPNCINEYNYDCHLHGYLDNKFLVGRACGCERYIRGSWSEPYLLTESGVLYECLKTEDYYHCEKEGKQVLGYESVYLFGELDEGLINYLYKRVKFG